MVYVCVCACLLSVSNPSVARTCTFARTRAGAWEGRVDGLEYAQARGAAVASFTKPTYLGRYRGA